MTRASLGPFPLVIVLVIQLARPSYVVHAYPASAQIDASNPVVQTLYGPVRGQTYQLSQRLTPTQRGTTFLSFIGVPYGAPPTGANRFGVSLVPFELEIDV